MAKEIKVIKCPNCGSVNKTELKTDFYKCNACQTEYFLDNNDVNINYNHNYNHSTPINNNERTIKVLAMVFGGIIGLFFLIFILSAIFSRDEPTPNNTYSVSTADKDEEDETFFASRYTCMSFLQPSTQQPVIVMLEGRRYNSPKNEAKNGSYIAFYNPIKKQLISEQKVTEKSLSTSDFPFRTFSDGNIYMVSDRSKLLKLNKETFKIEEAGKKFFEANEQLQGGVASIDFVYSDNGDGLVILTNDGKKRYYYPLIQKLYTEDQYYRANNGFNSVMPYAKNKTIHIFTEESSDYPEEKLQLLQITYKDNGPAPKDVTERLRWAKDYGGSGIFTERDPYKKVLVGQYDKERGRILNWKDITPGRLYFSPSVLLDDEQTLIIQFRGDANVKSGFKLQQINRQTGAVEWTVPFENNENLKTLLKYKDGFAGVNSNEELVVLDKKGNTVSNYKLK